MAVWTNVNLVHTTAPKGEFIAYIMETKATSHSATAKDLKI